MDKYVIAPPSGSTNNSVGAADRPWKEGHFEKLPNWQEYLAESTGYGIVSGCAPSISGLTVTVAAGVVHLSDGTRKEIVQTNITLDNADSTNPRIDLVYIDSTGAVAKVTGTAAASPSAPNVPTGGISVCNVTIAAGAPTGTITDKRGMLSRWYNTGIVNVKDFGAKGDGVTDDTEAIQAAIDYAEAGSIVFIPTGWYKISKTIIINKQITIVGSMQSQVKVPIEQFSATTICADENMDNEYIFDATYADTAPVAFRYLFVQCQDGFTVVHDKTTTGYPKHSFYVVFSRNVSGINMSAQNCIVDNCSFRGLGGKAINMGSYNTALNVRINNCNLGVAMDSDCTLLNPVIQLCNTAIITGSDARIYSARIEEIKEFGIWVKSSQTIISDVLIDRCGYAGVYYKDESRIYTGKLSGNIYRCGAYYGDTDISNIPTSDYKYACNVYVDNATGLDIDVISARPDIEDEPIGINAPTIGVYLNSVTASNIKTQSDLITYNTDYPELVIGQGCLRDKIETSELCEFINSSGSTFLTINKSDGIVFDKLRKFYIYDSFNDVGIADDSVATITDIIAGMANNSILITNAWNSGPWCPVPSSSGTYWMLKVTKGINSTYTYAHCINLANNKEYRYSAVTNAWVEV